MSASHTWEERALKSKWKICFLTAVFEDLEPEWSPQFLIKILSLAVIARVIPKGRPCVSWYERNSRKKGEYGNLRSGK